METPIILSVVPVSATVCANTEIPVQILLRTGADAVNAAQATLKYDPALIRVRTVSTGGSLFRFWPVQPTVDAAKGTVVFAGGLPTPGFTGENGLLLTVVIEPLKPDTRTQLVWAGGSQVFFNDGQGTAALHSVRNAALRIAPERAQVCLAPLGTPAVAPDTTPPEPFDVVIAQSEKAFDGKYFASFYAYDSQSGISRYEVRENNDSWSIQQSPYALRHQTGDVVLTVKAIDTAGNERIASTSAHFAVPKAFDTGPWWFWLIVFLVALAALGRALQKRKQRKEERQKTELILPASN